MKCRQYWEMCSLRDSIVYHDGVEICSLCICIIFKFPALFNQLIFSVFFLSLQVSSHTEKHENCEGVDVSLCGATISQMAYLSG